MSVKGLFEKETNEISLPKVNFKPVVKEFKNLVNNIPKIPDEISIDNFDEVKLHLRTELTSAFKKLEKAIGSSKFPKDVKVSNFPADIKVVNFPDTVTVDNFPLAPDTIKVENLDNVIKAVNGLKTIMSRLELNPNIEVKPSDVNIDINKLVKALKPLQLISDKPDSPISVQMSDGENFVEAIEKASDNLITTITGGQGFTQEEFQDTYRLAEDRLASYRTADVDEDASPNYYGFLNTHGRWYILKETLATGANTYRYVAGQSGYAAKWTSRVSLSYDYISEVKF